MKIKISAIEEKIISSLVKRGLNNNEAKIICDTLVEAECIGKKTHGISKLFLTESGIKLREGKPEIIKNKGNYVLIDAHKELGYLVANLATDLLIEKTKEFDNGIVAIKNSFNYSMAGIYAKKVAKAGFVSLILNNGGPAAITPFGGTDPLFGTNPIAIGIPTRTEPIILDMATSEKPWGEINLAKIEKRSLQEKTFLNNEGKFTTDPDKVNAIIPFGGYKGSGLNIMFEIMTGALVGAKMGLATQDSYDLGYLFLAYSPTMFTTQEKFYDEVEQLVKEIKNSKKMENVKEIYLPGENSLEQYKKTIDIGEIEIEENIWQHLCEFEQGIDIETKSNLKA